MTTADKLSAIAQANEGLDALLAAIPGNMTGVDHYELVGLTLLEHAVHAVPLAALIGLLTAAICRLKELERL